VKFILFYIQKLLGVLQLFFFKLRVFFNFHILIFSIVYINYKVTKIQLSRPTRTPDCPTLPYLRLCLKNRSSLTPSLELLKEPELINSVARHYIEKLVSKNGQVTAYRGLS
jgi:hypothetical protein